MVPFRGISADIYVILQQGSNCTITGIRVTLCPLSFPDTTPSTDKCFVHMISLSRRKKKALDQTPTRNIIHMSMKRGKNTAHKTNFLVQEDTTYSKACDSAKWKCWHWVPSELLHVSTRILACSLMCVIAKSSNSSSYKQQKSYTYALNPMITFSKWEIPLQLTYTWNTCFLNLCLLSLFLSNLSPPSHTCPEALTPASWVPAHSEAELRAEKPQVSGAAVGHWILLSGEPGVSFLLKNYYPYSKLTFFHINSQTFANLHKQVGHTPPSLVQGPDALPPL